jgi:hypothetical protein
MLKLSYKFELFWQSGSWKDNLQMSPFYTCTFVIISPLMKYAWFFIWTSLNYLHPSMICTQYDWNSFAGSGEDFQTLSVYFFSILLLFPIQGKHCPSFQQIWTPFTQGWFVPSLVEIDRVVLETTLKYEKFTDYQTDNGQSEKLTCNWPFSSGGLKICMKNV